MKRGNLEIYIFIELLMKNMSKCPYCNVDIKLEDFFDVIEKESKKGLFKKRIGDFKGERIHVGFGFNNVRMWVCPSCDKILGFSESAY